MRAVVEVSRLDGHTVGSYRCATDCDRANGWNIGRSISQARTRQQPGAPTMVRFAGEWDGYCAYPHGSQNVPCCLFDAWTKLATWYPSTNSAARSIGCAYPDNLSRARSHGTPYRNRWVSVQMKDTTTWPELKERLLAAGWAISEPELADYEEEGDEHAN